MTAQIIDFGSRLATKRELERIASERLVTVASLPGKVAVLCVGPDWNDMSVQARIERLSQLLYDWHRYYQHGGTGARPL